MNSENITHEWLCQQIVDQNRMAIISGDPQGRIQLWNKGAEEIFGWTAREAIGQSMDFIIPEKHREKHWTGYDRVMQTGETKYGKQLLAVPALTKSGTRISVEFTVVLIRDTQGKVVSIAATLQDITARWERDKELRQRLAAAEAQAKVTQP
ncbi:MAG TPA: PAS domain S-box protein [Terriglobales bacterium]